MATNAAQQADNPKTHTNPDVHQIAGLAARRWGASFVGLVEDI